MRWECLLMNQDNGPMDGSVMGTEFHFEASKAGVGVLIWAGIKKDELVGPFLGWRWTKTTLSAADSF